MVSQSQRCETQGVDPQTPGSGDLRAAIGAGCLAGTGDSMDKLRRQPPAKHTLQLRRYTPLNETEVISTAPSAPMHQEASSKLR
jgi:hypothetical protein